MNVQVFHVERIFMTYSLNYVPYILMCMNMFCKVKSNPDIIVNIL